jgi:hypothetical protein
VLRYYKRAKLTSWEVAKKTNKPLKVKQFDSIDIWTDAFINNANVMIDRQDLYYIHCLRYDPHHVYAWTPDILICLGGGCACVSVCCNAACSSTTRHMPLSNDLFTGSPCSPTLPLSTRHWYGGWILPVLLIVLLWMLINPNLNFTEIFSI